MGCGASKAAAPVCPTPENMAVPASPAPEEMTAPAEASQALGQAGPCGDSEEGAFDWSFRVGEEGATGDDDTSHMAATFSLVNAVFEELPTELLLRIIRYLLRDDPLVACRLVSTSRALRQLVREGSAVMTELQASRALLAQQRLFELRVAAGLEAKGGVPPVLVRSVSRQPSEPPAPVTKLKLSNCRTWRENSGEAKCRAVARFLRVSTALTELDLSSNQFGPEGACVFSDALSALSVSTALTVLRFGFNKIGDKGACAIAEALKFNTTLKDLRLGANEFGEKGASALADLLRVNTTLTTLNISNSSRGDFDLEVYTGQDFIRDKGASALADALRVNTTLSVLALAEHSIGDQGAHDIADALKVNTALTELNLYGNRIGPEGASAIADARKVNTTLKILMLDGNPLHPREELEPAPEPAPEHLQGLDASNLADLDTAQLLAALQGPGAVSSCRPPRMLVEMPIDTGHGVALIPPSCLDPRRLHRA